MVVLAPYQRKHLRYSLLFCFVTLVPLVQDVYCKLWTYCIDFLTEKNTQRKGPSPFCSMYLLKAYFTVPVWPLQSVFIKEVFSHRSVCLRRSDAGQTANVIAQLLDGVMAVWEEVLLEEVTQLCGSKTENSEEDVTQCNKMWSNAL